MLMDSTISIIFKIHGLIPGEATIHFLVSFVQLNIPVVDDDAIVVDDDKDKTDDRR